MKKLLIISLVLLLCASAFAIPRSEARNDRGQFTGPRASNSQDANIKSALAFVNAGLGTLSTGKIWFVDSGAGGNATGTSWTNASLTFNAAVDLCDADSGANRGDVIVGAPGHSETLGTLAFDVAGISVIGFGNGTLMPTIIYDTATDVVIVSAANITLKNLRFIPSVTEVVSGVAVTATGDGCTFIECDFGFAETSGTDEFDTAISIGGAEGAGPPTFTTIKDCFFHAEAAGASEAIYIGVVSSVFIENIKVFGDYATGCIVNVGAADDVVIERSLLFNGTMHGDSEINAVAALSMANSTGGYIGDNRFVTDVATALLMRIGDDMVFMNNYATDTDGDEFSGGLESGGNTVTVTPVTGT